MKEQVLITCLEEQQNEELVARLEGAVQDGIISHCHTFANDEVTVIVDMLHPSVNIQEDFVDKVLVKEYGSVKMWFPRRDAWTKFKTGEYVFIMKGEELGRRPIPRKILFNDRVLYVHYNSQPMICHRCGREGHKAQACAEYPGLGQNSQDGNEAERLAQFERQQRMDALKKAEEEAAAFRQQQLMDAEVQKEQDGDLEQTQNGLLDVDPLEELEAKETSTASQDEEIRSRGSKDGDEVKDHHVVPGDSDKSEGETDGENGSSVDPVNDIGLGVDAETLGMDTRELEDDKRKGLLARRGDDQENADDEDWTMVKRGRKRHKMQVHPYRTASLGSLSRGLY